MQKIHAGHLEGSVILVGSVGNSVDDPRSELLSLSLPSTDESVQLLLRPERSAGSLLIVTPAGDRAGAVAVDFFLLLVVESVLNEE